MPEQPKPSPIMAIACPHCASRFQVEKAKFPAGGRNVRCAKCQHVWHQAGPAAEALAAPHPVAGTAANAPIVPPVSQTPPLPEAPQAVAGSALPSPGDTGAQVADPIQRIRDRLANAANDIRNRNPSRPALAIGAAAFAGLFGLGAWLFILHNPAATAPPGPNAVRPGIELVDVKYNRQMTYGLGMIVTVSGTITNSTDNELPLPKTIAVALTDTANQELYHTVLAQTVKTLAGHKSVPFEAHIYNAPEKAQHLQVTLGGR